MDRGLNGSATAKVLYDEAVKWLDENTEMVLVAEFESQYAEGPAEQGVTAAMTANPQIDAVFSQGYVGCIARAFRNANRAIPVITGGGSNGTAIDVYENKADYVCLQWDCNLAGMGAMAMEQAIQMLEGNPPAEKHIVMKDAQWKSTNPEYADAVGVDIQAYEEGVNFFLDYPAGFSWPVLPADFPVQIKVEDLVERQQSFS
jgi:ribose transport system substrate-binding protein